MPLLSARRSLALQWLKWITYVLATVQVVRFYIATVPGVDMDRYLNGTAPLPFQKRYLPALLIRGMLHVPPLVHLLLQHRLILSPPARGCSLILSGISLAVAGYFCCRLYRATTQSRLLEVAVYPLFLTVVLISYAVHVEQNTNLPYDFPSLAFFSAGLYVIYTRRFVPLLFLVLAGTLNRETALFLIPIYILDGMGEGRKLRQVPWLRVLLLCAAWAAVEGTLSYVFRGNDRSQAYLRVAENLHRLRPENWSALLNICAYLLPFVLLLRGEIRPVRFGNYAFVAYPWLAVMVCYGVLTETRIYGELAPYVTVATLLLLERFLSTASTHAATNPALSEPAAEPSQRSYT